MMGTFPMVDFHFEAPIENSTPSSHEEENHSNNQSLLSLLNSEDITSVPQLNTENIFDWTEDGHQMFLQQHQLFIAHDQQQPLLHADGYENVINSASNDMPSRSTSLLHESSLLLSPLPASFTWEELENSSAFSFFQDCL